VNEKHWTIEYDCGTERVPALTKARLNAQLHAITASLPAIHAASPFWDSMRRSGLRVEIDGWEFGYRLDEEAERLVILYAVLRG
jgi:hypothetical protein